MKKKRIKNIILNILLILAIVLIALPYVNNYRIKQNMEKTVSTIDTISAKELTENHEKEVDDEMFDFSKIKDISPTDSFVHASDIDSSLIIGQLVIPSVNMNLTVFKGATNTNLLAGATTMKKEDKMGEGNFTLAGHYNKNKSILFGSLMDVKVGDIIRLTDKTTIYEYKVYSTKNVDDTALYMIDNEEAIKRGNSIISLMTCYFSSSTGQRYFVLGDLVSQYPYEKELMESVDEV